MRVRQRTLLFLLYAITAVFPLSAQPRHGFGVTNYRIADSDVTFLVVGDWGRNGNDHQKEVADQMEIYAKKYHSGFVISTGDNFYNNGVQSVDDPMWKSSFENIYTGKDLQTDWYVVLGNHDYHGMVNAEIDYTKHSARWRMPARYYPVEKVTPWGDSLLMIFMDSSPFVTNYHKQRGKYSDLDDQDTAAQRKWIQGMLRASSAKWKMVVAHHPVFSSGSAHGNTQELVSRLSPMLERYRANFFLCGHDHDLEMLRIPKGYVEYIVSGAGSETRPFGAMNPYSKFGSIESGFTMVTLTKTSAQISFINYLGKIIHSEIYLNPNFTANQ